MKTKLMLFLLAASLAVAAQGRPSGAGKPAGAGAGTGGGRPDFASKPEFAGKPETAGRPDSAGRPESAGKPENAGKLDQRPLKDSQLNSGAFRMLQEKTGMTSEQLQAMYQASGARNFGQFVSAVVVSRNLGLDTQQVLEGLKTQSLGQTLQELGVQEEAASEAIKAAKQEAKLADKKEKKKG